MMAQGDLNSIFTNYDSNDMDLLNFIKMIVE